MPEDLLLGIDQGGSGSRAALFHLDGRLAGYGYQRIERAYPQPGWVEQDPQATALGVRRAINDALRRANAEPDQLVAAGITSQRDTTFAWDAPSGAPIGRAITWQDLRSSPIVAEMDQHALGSLRRARLGQFPGAYAAAMHMAWRMRHDEPFRRAADEGRLRVSLAAGWLVRALGVPDGHALDISLLQGMTVFDPRQRALWDEWISALDLPRVALPEPRETTANFGQLRIGSSRRRADVPVRALIADQQAALFGYDCHQIGEAAATHGTASFVNVVIGHAAPPQQICKTYRAWELGDVPTFTLEADLSVTGAAVRWLTQIGVLRAAHELGPLAASTPTSGGMAFVPAFTGFGVPTEDRSARGTLIGMTLGTSRAQIARAFLESIGCQLRAAIAQITTESGVAIRALRVGGGLASSDEGCQIQADLLGIPLLRAQDTETGVRAAALLAGLGAGYYPNLAALPRLLNGSERIFEPSMIQSERDAIYERWQIGAERARGWVGPGGN